MEEPQQLCDALNAKGADITVQEVRQIAKSLSTQADGELDEDALEDVAGGVVIGSCPNFDWSFLNIDWSKLLGR